MEINVRRYKDGDASKICEIIKKDVLTENINNDIKKNRRI